MVTTFFLKTVEEVVSYRRKNKVVRNDFMQLMMNLMSKENDNDDDADALTMKQVAAQCFLFFFAGVETSATTISFALYELAKNQAIQDKVRDEINETLKGCGGKLTHDGVSKMVYMERVISGKL